MPGDIILLDIHVYHKWRSHDIRFLKYKVQQTEIFCHFRPFSALPFQPLDNPENQYFKIGKKTPGDIITLHISTINDNHWCIVPEIWSVWWTEFFVILDHFLSFYPPMDPENQNFDKRKKIPEDIIILQTYMTVIWCMVPQI